RRPRIPCALEGLSVRTRSRNASISGLDEAGAGVCRASLAMVRFYTESRSRGSVLAPRQMATRRRECKLAGLPDNVVNLQGLVHDAEPLSTGRGAPFAVLRQWQLHGVEQRNHFFPRCHVRQIWPRTKCLLIQIVECGQPS